MEIHKKLAIAGLTAGLVGGGAAGAVLGTSGISGAQPAVQVQQEDDTATTDEAPAEGERPEPGQHLAEAIAPLVEDGTITQAQADAVVAAIQEARPEGPRGHHGPGRGMKGGEAAAEALGITTDELRQALRDGATLAEVAALQGVDVQVVIDAMVAEAREHIEQAVEDGRLTREEADEKLAELTERITDVVNNGRPEGEGPRGPRGPGGPGAEDGED
jgi:polyhydroxyalkanoate synthesis regulator phasin